MKKHICWVFLFPVVLHSYWINSPFIPSLLIQILTLLSSAGKLKVCLVVRGHWINHFKQEICWGFRISSVTCFSFLFSTAFPLLFVKEKSVEQDQESESARKWVVLWPSLQESEWLILPSRDSWIVADIFLVQHLAAAEGGSDVNSVAKHWMKTFLLMLKLISSHRCREEFYPVAWFNQLEMQPS